MTPYVPDPHPYIPRLPDLRGAPASSGEPRCLVCDMLADNVIHQSPVPPPQAHPEPPLGEEDAVPKLGELAQDGYDVAEPMDTPSEGPGDNTGVMVALYPDQETALVLAIPDGEAAEDLHVTLAYLGEVGQYDADQLAVLEETVGNFAKTLGPIDARISGWGVFDNPGGEGGDKVTYASVDAPVLPDVRQGLVEALTAAGFSVVANHGFSPHISLAYANISLAVPSMAIEFESLSLVAGTQRYDYPLGGVDADEPVEARAYTTPRDDVDMTQADFRAAMDRSAPERPETEPETARAFVTEVNGKTLLTAPVRTVATWEKALTPNEHVLWLQGRLVGAEEANRNGAFWSTKDLEFGEPTVRYGPLNWLHEGRHIVGSLADAKFVQPDTGNPYIAIAAGIWRWLYPEEAAVVEMADEQKRLAISLECISRQVECVGSSGCGHTIEYGEYVNGGGCDHMRQRSGVRRFVEPTFLGAGVIVPPARPGWAGTETTLMRQAASLAEDAYEQMGRPADLPAAEVERLLAGVLVYAQNRPTVTWVPVTTNGNTSNSLGNNYTFTYR